ncbi:uncharacterized protein LOC143256674 isoform X1 [Tachypleus tridentatus]|uniref:uncharacterized protein LOC143256674 isoform X1 n=1 Tax=Tachypleus tridentatus TaxID=6853 RepID=UPI003FD2B2DF
MSSTENKTEVSTKKVEENVHENEKGSGDLKSQTSPQKRTASEVISSEDEVKQKVLKKKKMGNQKRSLKKMLRKKMKMKKTFLKEREKIMMRKEMRMELMKRVMKTMKMHNKFLWL